jgi:hypothetical protein
VDALVREHDVHAIMIYDSWFEDQRDGVPSSWVPVEEWCLEGGTVRIVGGRCVTWYGRRPTTRPSCAGGSTTVDSARRHQLPAPRRGPKA